MQKESLEARQLRLNNLDHVRTLRKIITGNRSLVKEVIEKLSIHERVFLFKVAGIECKKTVISGQDFKGNDVFFLHGWNVSFDELSDDELKSLQKTIRTMYQISRKFMHCNKSDFSKPDYSKGDNYENKH